MEVDKKVENQEIIKKIRKWLENIQNENNPEKAVEMFEEMFEDEYENDFVKDNNEDYYEYYEETYKLKNGLILSVVTGAGMIYSNEISHRGTDVYLCINHHAYNEYRVYIFSQNEKREYKRVLELLFQEVESEVNKNE